MKAIINLIVSILGFFIVGMFFLKPTPFTVFNAIMATINLGLFLYANSESFKS